MRTEHRLTASVLGQVPFQAHLELLQSFLAHRDEIVEGIERVATRLVFTSMEGVVFFKLNKHCLINESYIDRHW